MHVCASQREIAEKPIPGEEACLRVCSVGRRACAEVAKGVLLARCGVAAKGKL